MSVESCGTRRASGRMLAQGWFLAPGFRLLCLTAAALTGCSRPVASTRTDATAVASSGALTIPITCTTHEQLAQQPCRTGARSVDKLPSTAEFAMELSHCPLDDCGSGGCSYDLYGMHGGCLRRLGNVHGAWIDVAPPTGSSLPSIRTWGRSGTTHVATEYDIQGGELLRRRQFTCDYASSKPLPAECPKL